MTVYSRVLAESYLSDGVYGIYVMGYLKGKKGYKGQVDVDGMEFFGDELEILNVTKEEFVKIQKRNPAGDIAYEIEDILSPDWGIDIT